MHWALRYWREPFAMESGNFYGDQVRYLRWRLMITAPPLNGNLPSIVTIHCEHCGEETGSWESVPDCDPSVGYHGRVEVCEDCRDTYSNHCGACG